MTTDNPLLTPSDLPYGLPAFRDIQTDQFADAFDAALTEHRAEIAVIAANAESPTFTNTIEAFERSGQQLQRVAAVFFNATAADADTEIEQLHADLAPKLSAHDDEIHLNVELFARIDHVHAARDHLDLDDEQRWLVTRTYLAFVRAGAALNANDRAQLKALNSELATLETEFQRKALAGQNAATLVVDEPGDLAGFTDDEIAAAAQAANDAGHNGKYAITLDLPTDQPALATLEQRGIRERLLKASWSRGFHDEHSTENEVLQIARLRAERAQLLGFESHAAYAIADQTAKTPTAARGLLTDLAGPAADAARTDAAALAELAAHDGIDTLEPWDWQFYAEKLRSERHDFSGSDLRPYFELDRVLADGVFYAAEAVYGITLKLREDLAGYHDEVSVYEVFDADGSGMGLYLADFFSRATKRGGAWMNSLVAQSHMLGTSPVVVNNFNFTKPADGKPTLLTFDEVRTLFHEFGHALHGLFGDVQYQRFTGTSVPRDFVEFPSQVNEMWALWPEVVSNYARHYETGEPIPADLLDRLTSTQQFNHAQHMVSYLASSLLDLSWHELTPEQIPDDVETFEAEVLSKVGLDLPTIPPRYRSTYFAHIFFGGYSAGYYSYVWSEVLDADSVAWFSENGGMSRKSGDRFRSQLLGKGGSGEVMEFYRQFRGSDPDRAHLLERLGLAAAQAHVPV